MFLRYCQLIWCQNQHFAFAGLLLCLKAWCFVTNWTLYNSKFWSCLNLKENVSLQTFLSLGFHIRPWHLESKWIFVYKEPGLDNIDDCFLRYKRADFPFIQNCESVIMNGKNKDLWGNWCYPETAWRSWENYEIVSYITHTSQILLPVRQKWWKRKQILWITLFSSTQNRPCYNIGPEKVIRGSHFYSRSLKSPGFKFIGNIPTAKCR